VCLQLTGDQLKCNFGSSKHPFHFELDSHIAKLQFKEQFSHVKAKPVDLQTIYGLVKGYLAAMAYAETLEAVDAEYGAVVSHPVVDFAPEEETKVM